MKTIMVVLAALGFAGCARTGTLSGGPDGSHTQASQSSTCHVEDLERYLQQLRPDAIEAECAAHGGSVSSIAASQTFGHPLGDPDHVFAGYAITCVNGDVLIANVLMNSGTCDTESVLTSPTERIR
jgi:hypothetical protein